MTDYGPPAVKRQKLQEPQDVVYPSAFPLELFKPDKRALLNCIYSCQAIDGILSLSYMAACAAMRHECKLRADDRDLDFDDVYSIEMTLNGSQINCLTYLAWAAMSSNQKLCNEFDVTYGKYTVMICLTHGTREKPNNVTHDGIRNVVKWEIRYLEAMKHPTEHYNMQRIKQAWKYMAIKGEMIQVKTATSHVAAELPKNHHLFGRKGGDFWDTDQRLPWLCVRTENVLPITKHPFSQISETDLPDSVVQKIPKHHRLMISPKPIEYSLNLEHSLSLQFGDDADGHNIKIMTYICEVLWNHRACVPHHGGMSYREIAACIPWKDGNASIFFGDDGRPGIWKNVCDEILKNLRILMSYHIVNSNTSFRQPSIRLMINRYHLIHNIKYTQSILKTMNPFMLQRAQEEAYHETEKQKSVLKKNVNK